MKTKITTVTAGTQALRFLVIAQKAGAAAFRVLHVTPSTADPKKKVVVIGARAKFATVDAAIKHQDAAVAQAIKDGWAPTTRTFGGAAKPDAFSLASLPKPAVKPVAAPEPPSKTKK